MKAVVVLHPDDNVVEQRNPEKFAGLQHLSRQFPVLGARPDTPAGMVVDEDQRSGVTKQHRPKNIRDPDAGGGEAALAQQVAGDGRVCCTEVEGPALLVRPIAQKGEPPHDVLGTVDCQLWTRDRRPSVSDDELPIPCIEHRRGAVLHPGSQPSDNSKPSVANPLTIASLPVVVLWLAAARRPGHGVHLPALSPFRTHLVGRALRLIGAAVESPVGNWRWRMDLQAAEREGNSRFRLEIRLGDHSRTAVAGIPVFLRLGSGISRDSLMGSLLGLEWRGIHVYSGTRVAPFHLSRRDSF